MNKIFLSFGAIAAAFLLVQIYEGNISGNDVMMAGVENMEEAVVEEAVEIEKEDRDLKILAFGDIMLSRYVRTLMDRHGKDYIFANIVDSEGKFLMDSGFGADIIFGNFEGPINGKGTSGGTSMVFSFNEDTVPFLKSYGFNMLSLANNHAMDQGQKGRENTVKAMRENSIGWCGHPSEVDYLSVAYKLVEDKVVAFACFQDVTAKLDDEKAVELIRRVRPFTDYLIVSAHWGVEYKHNADPGLQTEPGRAFIDAGADFVIGHHPHVVQNFEIYNGKFIFYSLGNFVFDQYWSKATQEQLAIGIVLDDADEKQPLKTQVHLFPMKSEKSQSRLMTDAERAEWIERFIGYGEYDENVKVMIRAGVLEF